MGIPCMHMRTFLRHHKIVLDRLNVVDIVLKCICIFYASALRCKLDTGTSTEGTIRPGFPISLPENKMFLRVFLPHSAVKEKEKKGRWGAGGAALPGCFRWIWSTATFSCFIKCSVRRRWCHFIARHTLPVLNLFIWTSCHSVFCVCLCIEYFL